MRDVYITSTGSFLPGAPIGNEDMERYLGMIGGTPSRLRARILKQNGIKSRHYALDETQRTTHSNAELAVAAIREALQGSGVLESEIDFLALATTQGDLPVPGFASMVHGELETPACAISSHHGICSSGMMALRSAFLEVGAGEKENAVACASELPSRLFKASRFEQQAAYRENGSVPFDTDFLRWMLSDGAGAMVLEPTPDPRSPSLKIEWLEIKSLASKYDPCMYVGPAKNDAGHVDRSWLDFDSYHAAADVGAINLRQDTRMLKDVMKCAVDGFFELIEAGKLEPEAIDWFCCHYSSHIFRGEARELMKRGGVVIPEERWFTNLYSKGNTGAASIFIMLDELFRSGNLKAGQQILCVVPESGRFSFAYMLATVVAAEAQTNRAFTTVGRAVEEIEPPLLRTSGSELEASLVRQLARVWVNFEQQLNQVPIVDKLNRGRLSMQDYRDFLFNLRQQVIDGSRWIARAASNITREYFPIRSAFIAHTSDEHRDYEMLEKNYVAVGGQLEDMYAGTRNIGSEALTAFILHQASRENPFDLIGAMFIIEGLGMRIARRWGTLIQDQLNLTDDQVSFFLYHSESDAYHFERLDMAVQSGILTPSLVDQIVKTAKVTARLYLLQLEEIGTF